jgi:hypothetical protein
LEGFPNTFIQAWMRKVPVLTLGINPDNLFVEKNIGVVSNNYEGLLSNLKRLIEDPVLRNNMGTQALNYAYKTHSQKNINNLVRFFDQ